MIINREEEVCVKKLEAMNGNGMKNDCKVLEINGHIIEFIESAHCYVCDGIIVPSVTGIVSIAFEQKFKVNKKTLEVAGKLGTKMHKEIEMYEKTGLESNSIEFKNYLFLKEKYGFKNIANELIVLYEEDGIVKYIGTLDQLIEMDNKLGINDFKRVSCFDRKKVEMQLTLYAIAYEQSYGKKIEFIAGTHLKNEKRKFYDNLVRNDKKALGLVKKFYKKRGKLKC